MFRDCDGENKVGLSGCCPRGMRLDVVSMNCCNSLCTFSRTPNFLTTSFNQSGLGLVDMPIAIAFPSIKMAALKTVVPI